MNLTGLLFLLVTHFFTGKGLIRLFRIQLEPIATLCFSMLCGVFVASLLPCIMELTHVPLTQHNMYIWLGATAGVFSIPLLINIKQTKIPKVELPKLYELPFIAIFLWLVTISVWRCFYYPVTPRDMLTGPELIAEFAVREKTMINSVFTTDLRMHPGAPNNIFKSPFVTGLQIIYKMFVHPFGQEWLSVVFVSFTLWFYTFLRARIHPFVASILLLLFFATPELYAYTYIILHDYSNMVFFFGGVYFMSQYLETKKMNMLFWSAFLLGVATYIRAETLILTALGMAPLAFYYFRKKESLKTAALSIGLYLVVPFLFNFLCSSVFVKHLIPLDYNLGKLINDPFNFSLLFEKMGIMGSKLMLGPKADELYGLFFRVFMLLVVIDCIWPRKFNFEARVALISSAVVFLGLGIVAYLIAGASLENTIKRGLFKIIPLMVWYMVNSGLLQKFSDFLKRVEAKASAPKVAPVVTEKSSPAPTKKQKTVPR